MGNAVRTPSGGKMARVLVYSASTTPWDPYVDIDVKPFLPEKVWKKLTVDNFGAVITSVWCDRSDNEVGVGNSGTSTYNSDTGILHWFTGTRRHSGGTSVPRRIFQNVYCWYAE